MYVCVYRLDIMDVHNVLTQFQTYQPSGGCNVLFLKLSNMCKCWPVHMFYICYYKCI